MAGEWATAVPGEASELLQLAADHAATAHEVDNEVGLLLEALEPRCKNPSLTGLPAFVRALRRDKEVLSDLVQELSLLDLDLAALSQALVNKINSTATSIRHTALHWSILKRSRALVGVNQTFQGSTKQLRRAQISQRQLTGREKGALQKTLKVQGRVDVHVVDWGREWVEVRTLHEDRLVRQMTDCGWAWGEHAKGKACGAGRVDEAEWDDVPLAKQVQRLVAAARVNRCQYQVPRLRVVLPNVSRRNADVDILLDQLVDMDPLVSIRIEDCDSPFLTEPPPPANVAVTNLAGDELETLTHALNLDHPILIDLISDITHLELQSQQWQSPSTQVQIDEEANNKGLMVKTLYPVLAGRKLVCTKEAAEHFHEVLKTVGTDTERERGRLLVPFDDATTQMTPTAIRHRFQTLSTHTLPSNIQIPFTILPDPWTLETVHRAIADGRLPRVAEDVARVCGFKSSKLSIFAHGWASGHVTVTSNREVRGQIRTWVEAHRHDDAERGPVIWRVDVTRNLLSKSATPPEAPDEVKDSDVLNGEDDG